MEAFVASPEGQAVAAFWKVASDLGNVQDAVNDVANVFTAPLFLIVAAVDSARHAHH